MISLPSNIFPFQDTETDGMGLARIVKLNWLGFPIPNVLNKSLVGNVILGATLEKAN